MRKILESKIFLIIITAIICISGTIYAETKINADKVTYSGSITVKDKIDDLYIKQTEKIANYESIIENYENTMNEKLANKISENINSSYSGGEKIANRVTSLNLSAGEYLVFGVYNHNGFYAESSISSFEEVTWVPLTSNGECNTIKSMSYINYASKGVDNTTFLSIQSQLGIWKCKLNGDATIILERTASAKSTSPQFISLYSIKLD